MVLPQERLHAPQSGGLSAPAIAPTLGGDHPSVALGAALQRSGVAFSRLGSEMEERRQIAIAKEAQALAEERIQHADRAYRTRLGKDATGQARSDADQELVESLTRIEEGIEEGPTRRAFSAVIRRRLLAVRDQWDTHEDRQVLAYEIAAGEAATEAKKQAAIQQGPTSPTRGSGGRGSRASGAAGIVTPGAPGGDETATGEPETRATLLDSVRAEARSVARKKGLPPEAVELEVQRHATDVHVGVVTALVEADRTGEARDYLAGIVGGDIQPEARTKLQVLVRRAERQNSALRRALDIQREADNPPVPEKEKPAPGSIEEAQADLRRWMETRPTAAWETQTTKGETREAVVSALELETVGTQRLNQLFDDGEIDAEEYKLVLNWLGVEADRRRRVAAERENSIMDAMEKWAVENRGLGLSGMPSTLYQQIVDVGRLPETIAFLENGRHSTDEFAVSEFLSLSKTQLRKIGQAELRAQLRTRMDNSMLKWAMGVWANAHEPGSDIESEFERQLIEEWELQVGVENSSLERRRRATGRVTSNQEGLFLSSIGTKRTETQARAHGRLMIELHQRKEAARAAGEDITKDVLRRLFDEIVIEDAANVKGRIWNDYGVPKSVATQEQLAEMFTLRNGDKIFLRDIPGQGRRQKVDPDLSIWAVGDVQGVLMEDLAARGEAMSPRNIADYWDWLGRPATVHEFKIARRAAADAAESLPRGQAATDEAARRAALDALRDFRDARAAQMRRLNETGR